MIISPGRALAILLVLFCSGLAACGEPEPVRIGFFGGTTGRAAGLGVSGRNGFVLAVEQANAAGGINGRRIEPVFGDDRMDAGTAPASFRALLDRQVVAVVGPMTSQIAVAVVPEANRASVPLVSPTVSTNLLTGLDDYFLRVYYNNAQAAALLAEFLAGERNRPRMLAISDQANRAYTEDWISEFRRRYAERGGEMVAVIPFDSGNATSFGGLADQALEKSPQGILFLANAVDTAMIAQQFVKRGVHVPLYATGWSYTDDLLQFGGKSVEGLTIIQSANLESAAPAYQDFRRSYQELFQHPPNFPAVHAYDATRAVLAALARSGAGGRQFKEALINLPATAGAQGIVAFDRFGDLRDPKLHLAVITDGAYRTFR